MIKASVRLLRITTLWALTALLPLLANQWAESLYSAALTCWTLTGALVVLAAVIDLVLGLRLPAPDAHRQLPAALSIHRRHTVTVQLAGLAPNHEFILADQHPDDDDSTGLPTSVRSATQGNVTEVSYRYRPLHRGKARFGDIELWRASPLGLFWRRHRIAAKQEVPVYPDFSVLQRDALHAHQESQLDPAQHRQPRRGEGFEFHQLREYHSGDSLRQIDWKASARRRKLISREYQEEQNQQIIVLLDGGERMAMRVNGMTGFDHALNATLLLSWSAIKQQDKPGVMLFSNDQTCWIPPVRGHNGTNRILNALYTLQPGNHASDYSRAAQSLIKRWNKHSLIVLITRLQPDDEPELLAAVKLLSRRHLLLIADLQLPEQQAIANQDIRSVDDALLACGDAAWQAQRHSLYGRLRHAGAMLTDSTPEQLPARLNQIYLSLKRSGRI